MCCSECLARSGMAVSPGTDDVHTEQHEAVTEDSRNTAAPRILRDIMGPMMYLEGGGEEATPRTPSFSSRSPPGTS